MLFLIEYDRDSSRIVRLEEYAAHARPAAAAARLQIELDLNRRNVQHEVVILEAASKEALRRTHRRYFDDLRTIAQGGPGGD